MTTETMHWAAELIGKPYRRGAHGPDEFDCWGLVRYVFAEVHGIAMPAVDVQLEQDPTPANVAAIKRAAAASGWRLTTDQQPATDDIVMMLGLEGRHVGTIVEANGAHLLLHALERVGVCAQPLADLQRAGFHAFEFWRRRGTA